MSETASPSLIFTTVFALALVAGTLLKFWLASRQLRHVAQHRSAVPDNFSHTVSLAAHQKAADYTIAKTRFGLLELALGAAVLLGWTLLGGLNALNAQLLGTVGPGMAQQLALIVAFTLIGGLIELPLAWPSVLTAAILTFAHTLGEFGVVLMVGGNLPGETRTLSVAIYDRMQAFDDGAAGVMAATLLVIAVATLMVTTMLSRRVGPRRA